MAGPAKQQACHWHITPELLLATSTTSGQWAAAPPLGDCVTKNLVTPKEWSGLCPQLLGSSLRQGGFV